MISVCVYSNQWDELKLLFQPTKDHKRCYAEILLLSLKLLLRGHNISYKVMEHFIHCCVSLEINKGQMGSSNASDVKLFAVKVTPK